MNKDLPPARQTVLREQSKPVPADRRFGLRLDLHEQARRTVFSGGHGARRGLEPRTRKDHFKDVVKTIPADLDLEGLTARTTDGKDARKLRLGLCWKTERERGGEENAVRETGVMDGHVGIVTFPSSLRGTLMSGQGSSSGRGPSINA